MSNTYARPFHSLELYLQTTWLRSPMEDNRVMIYIMLRYDSITEWGRSHRIAPHQPLALVGFCGAIGFGPCHLSSYCWIFATWVKNSMGFSRVPTDNWWYVSGLWNFKRILTSQLHYWLVGITQSNSQTPSIPILVQQGIPHNRGLVQMEDHPDKADPNQYVPPPIPRTMDCPITQNMAILSQFHRQRTRGHPRQQDWHLRSGRQQKTILAKILQTLNSIA